MKTILIAIVRVYQLMISPYFPSSCRYYPTCSQYAIDALKIHGFFKGTGLAAWRLLRCHPWAEGGEDPVPDKKRHCECAAYGKITKR
ncbi:MAG: membrane protein insertion efficiency factor YidD [Balneolales bacterium]